jgi:hypothetical protein
MPSILVTFVRINKRLNVIMKSPFKITLVVLAVVMCLYVSCKKTEIASKSPNKTSINTDDVAKQISLSLYNSLASGVNTSGNLKTTAAHGGLTTMGNHGCGEMVTSFTDKTVTSGDTTRKYLGNSIFTYLCNGYFSNKYVIDAFALADTLKTTETGPGFSNNYNVTLNYTVQATDSHYAYVIIGGTTTTSQHLGKIDAHGATTEYHDLITRYKLNDIAAKRTATNPVYTLGTVDFNTSVIYKDATTDIDGYFGGYSGYFLFLPDNTANFYFKNSDGTYKVYLSNLLTGEVKPL